MAVALSSLVQALHTIAPLELAEEWDNVGLLIDPRPAYGELSVERVLLTIDPTLAVLREAALGGVGCLVSYHPPLFRPVRRLAYAQEPAVFEAISHGFAIYSPHTALDAAAGGLNDWLVEAFGPGPRRSLVPSAVPELNAELKLVVFVPAEATDALRAALADAGAGLIGRYSHCSFANRGEGTFFGHAGAVPAVGEAGRLERAPEVRIEMVCSKRALPAIARALAAHHPYEEPAWDVYPLSPKFSERAGAGRLVEVETPTTLTEAVESVKRHLGLSQVRVAPAEAHAAGRPLKRIAVCAGSGGSLFEPLRDVDLYVTGEMRHHDVLAKLAQGASVVLCEHSNTERGYLPRLADRLRQLTDGTAEILISTSDREPLQFA